MNKRLTLTAWVPVVFSMIFFAAAAHCAPTLKAVLDAQPAEVQARYDARHPQQTLDFFGVKPGMTVVEAFPGRGWYSKILIAALGTEGRMIGADYAYAMYPMFNFYDDAYLEAKKSWQQSWVADAATWVPSGGAPVEAFILGSMPATLDGQVDAILFVRALHNLARFEGNGGYLTTALAEAHRALKSGGVVGVVQHQAPADASDAWADGSNGYLKKAFVIETLTAAGFELVGESPVNLNAADQPTEDDFVWRLPPSLVGAGDDAEKRARMEAVGESTRMTLLFRKP
jgi:predicted methyltransferase